jgi:hypothetical protein
MITKKEVTIIECDSCGKEISGNVNSVTIPSYKKGKMELCSSCYRRLMIVLNWKKYRDEKVALNFNSNIETTLGGDATDAYNKYWGKFGGDYKSQGDIWETQLHNYCKTMSPAFEKMIGSYQGLAFPFEMRIKLKDLSFKGEIYNEL